MTTLQSIQTDFPNMICYGGTKIQVKNVVQRNVKNIKRRIFFIQKTVNIWKKVYIFCSLHSTTKTLRGLRNIFCPCVPPLYQKDFNKYLPQDCINSPLLEKPFAENTVVTFNVSEKVPQVLWCWLWCLLAKRWILQGKPPPWLNQMSWRW